MLKVGDTALVLGFLAIGAIAATYALVAARGRFVQGPFPRHFDLLGRPDAWSGRWILWFHPSFALVFLVGMVLLLATVVEEEAIAPSEYEKVAEILASAGALIGALVLFVTERSIAIARKRATGLGWMFAPCVAVALTLLVLHYS